MAHSTSAAAAAAAAAAAKLPDAAVACILAHLPQQERLRDGARVCRSWAAAAAVATRDISDSSSTCRIKASKAPAFEAWLQQHAAHVDSIDVRFDTTSMCISDMPSLLAAYSQLPKPEPFNPFSIPGSHKPINRLPASSGLARLQLPCAKLTGLQQLELAGCDVQLQDADAAALPQLARLRLAQCDVQLRGTAALPQLRSLQLQRCKLDDVTVDALLPQLTQLTSFEVEADEAVAAAIGSMQQLQELHVREWGSSEAEPLCLPQSLTALRINDKHWAPMRPTPLTPATVPSLGQLSNLMKLALGSMRFDGGMLYGLSQLTHLDLSYCTLLPLEPRPDYEDDDYEGYGDGDDGEEEQESSDDNNDGCGYVGPKASKAGSAALLSALACLTRLHSLRLYNTILRGGADVAAQCSALTASSHLEDLEVTGDARMPLPLGAGQHMFPAGRQLPALAVVKLGAADEEKHGYTRWMKRPALTGDCLRGMVSCCPALKSLSLEDIVQADADLSCLLQLAGGVFNTLQIRGEAFGDDAAAVISQLPGLQALYWGYTPLTDRGLERLTALTSLTALEVDKGRGLPHSLYKLDRSSAYMPFWFKTSKEDDVPVSQQLWRLSVANPAYEEDRMARLRKHNDEKAADHARHDAEWAKQKAAAQAAHLAAGGLYGEPFPVELPNFAQLRSSE